MSTEVEVDGGDKLPEILERSKFQATRELRVILFRLAQRASSEVQYARRAKQAM